MSETSDLNNDESQRQPLSRRNVIMVGGLGGLTAAGLALLNPLSALASEHGSGAGHGWHGSRPHPTQPTRSFVQVRGVDFSVDGMPWRFGGTNCYYLHTSSHYMIDSMLDNAAVMDLKVVRCWAFNDDPSSETALQPSPYTYPEDAFDSLDYAVYKAGQLGLRLVLPLVNNWPDYGGMQQYVKWFLGLPDDSYAEGVNHDRFYTDPAIRKCFLAYIQHVITRKNRYTGLRYADDPTIMTWELANEPRNRSDKTGAQVKAWADAVSRQIKRWAPRQLTALGDEGFGLQPSSTDYPYSTYEGDRWLELTSLPALDYGTYHLYPQGWGETADPVGWGTTWISDHIAAAKKLGKPAVLEEFGLAIDPSRGVGDSAARDTGYDTWLTAVERAQGAGTQFWILTALTDAGVLYPDYDGYRVVYPSSTASLMTTHAERLAATVR